MESLPEELYALIASRATYHSLAMLALTSKSLNRRVLHALPILWSNPQSRYHKLHAALEQEFAPGPSQLTEEIKSVFIKELDAMDGLPKSYLQPDGSNIQILRDNAYGQMLAILPCHCMRLLSVLICDTAEVIGLLNAARASGLLPMLTRELLLEPIIVRAQRRGSDWTPEQLLAVCEAMYRPDQYPTNEEEHVEEAMEDGSPAWDWDEDSLYYINAVLQPLRPPGWRTAVLAAAVSEEIKTATFRLYLATRPPQRHWLHLFAWYAKVGYGQHGYLGAAGAGSLAVEVAANHDAAVAVRLLQEIAARERVAAELLRVPM